MRDKVHQSSTFRHVQTETSQLCCKGIKARPDVFWDLNIYVQILRLFEKKSVNSKVLSFILKLFRTKVDIKSVIRDYSLRNYVVNVQSLKTCKLSKYSIEISEDPRSHLGS